MLTTFALLAAHHLVLALLFVAGTLVSSYALRGAIVETLAVSAEAAILWYAGRMLAADFGDTQVAIVSYAPFVGASIAFVLLTLGAGLYDSTFGARMVSLMSPRLRRALAWQFGPSDAPPR